MTNKDCLKPYEGCETSFEKLFKEHHRRLIFYARKLVWDHFVAEDIVQDVFIIFLYKGDDNACELAKKMFLYHCTRNQCIDYLRKSAYRVNYKKTTIRNAEEYEDIILNQVTRKDLVNKLRQIIETLPPVCKSVVTLGYIKGLNNKEIADQLNLSFYTVRNHKSQGLKWIKKGFEKFNLNDKPN